MPFSKRFKRTIEDFVCGECGADVTGTGYTNHCPRCLWSRHVDISPGDRRAGCGGMMEPVGVEMKGENFIVIHRCLRCKKFSRNKVSDDDSMDRLRFILHKGT